MSRRLQGELEDASFSSSVSNQGSTSAFVAMMASSVILLVMLAACSPSAIAQVPAPRASVADARPLEVVVPIERLTVLPSPEILPPPAIGRWQRFEEALNAGPSRKYRVVESATNDGLRMARYEPCVLDCSVTSGGVSLAGRGFGR